MTFMSVANCPEDEPVVLQLGELGTSWQQDNQSARRLSTELHQSARRSSTELHQSARRLATELHQSVRRLPTELLHVFLRATAGVRSPQTDCPPGRAINYPGGGFSGENQYSESRCQAGNARNVENRPTGPTDGTRSVACQDSNPGPLGSESSTLSLRHTTPRICLEPGKRPTLPVSAWSPGSGPPSPYLLGAREAAHPPRICLEPGKRHTCSPYLLGAREAAHPHRICLEPGKPHTCSRQAKHRCTADRYKKLGRITVAMATPTCRKNVSFRHCWHPGVGEVHRSMQFWGGGAPVEG
ncbi:hypothetical protein Bbelb_098650 [Branchiostoma belcheri]|nr:hypothetical protein Bbelb_098650 [Branchiostoma belcheri]